MTLKVITYQDVDNRSIIIGSANKLEAMASKDSGLIQLPTTTNVADGSWIKLRRVGNVVYFLAGGLRYDLWGMKGTTEQGFFRSYSAATYPGRLRIVAPQGIPVGFRSDASTIFSTFDDDLRIPKGSIYVGGVRDANYIAFDYQGEVPAVGYKNLRVPIVSWITSDPFPT